MEIPEDWQKIQVGKLCKSIVPGRNKPKIFDGVIPWVTTPEIQGRYIPSEAQKNYVSEIEIKNSGGKIVPIGSIIIAAVGELGLTAITKCEVVLNQQLHAFVCPKNTSNEYVAYFLETQKQYMSSVASKTTIPYMNKGNCESIPILLPPLKEQKRIAEILGTWDRAISVTGALIVQSEAQKKALMQQLLTGKRRLPGFEGDWREVKLGDVVSLWKGKQKGRAELTGDGPIPVINGGVSASGYTEESNAPAGTITISEGGNSCGYVALQDGPFWCGGHCYALLKPKMEINFLFAQLKHSQRQIMRLRVGSGLPNIQKKDLSQLKLLLPSVEEQKAIGELFSACDLGLSQLQTKLQTLKTEKAALMQQLLTGKRRVKLTDAA